MQEQLTRLTNAGEHERHPLVATVGSDSNIDLEGEIIFVIGLDPVEMNERKGEVRQVRT